MAADRADGLAYLQGLALNTIMTTVGRLTTDSSTGYGPVLDWTLRRLGIDSSTWADADIVADADVEQFYAVLEWRTYDLVLPLYALIVDQQVDQPLTNIKANQMYLNLSKERENARNRALECGFGGGSLVFARVPLDFNEPSDKEYLDQYGY